VPFAGDIVLLEDWRAIAAIAASAVAIIGGAFGGLSRARTFLRERKTGLDVRVDTDVFSVGENEGVVLYVFARLRVRAHAGGGPLSHVQARLVACNPAPMLRGGTTVRQREFYLAFRTAHEHEPSMSLSPGEARYIDLLYMQAGDAKEVILTLANTPTSPPGGYKLVPGHYKVGVRVTAAEARARELELTIKHSGDWDGSEQDADTALNVQLTEKPAAEPMPPPPKKRDQSAA